MLKFDSVSLAKRLVNVNLHINRAEWWALLGPNGAGKTSLLSLTAALEQPSAGAIEVMGVPLTKISIGAFSARRCLVSQAYRTEFSISVRELLRFFTQLDHVPELIERHLEVVSLIEKSFDKLSGGEKQRIHLARNLMQIWSSIETGSALVLLDEPLQQMDISHQVHALALIQEIQALGNAIVMSHHDINQTMQYCTHACLIKAGAIVQAGRREQVMTQANMETLFSQSFTILRDEQGEKHVFLPK